jgi:hypothetical protein
VKLWFVLHTDLKQFDPSRQARRIDGRKTTANNITIETNLLGDRDLRAAGVDAAPEHDGPKTLFMRMLGRFSTERLEFEVTNRTMVSQTGESVVIAVRTDPAFSKGKRPSNIWMRTSDEKNVGGRPERPYQGGISYAKVSQLAGRRGALIVELHGAWVEPNEWFDGGAALASKLKGAANEGIKSLRDELAADQAN